MKNRWWTSTYEFLDIPSGVMMGVCTISVLVFSYAAVFAGKKIPGEVVAIYGSILGAYAASQTIKKIAEAKHEKEQEEQRAGREQEVYQEIKGQG